VSKGDKPARVPLPLPALPAVEAAIDGRTSGPLLRTHTGAGMDRRSVHRYVARTAGISRPIGPHALRRTVGLNHGVPVADIQPLPRHARPETTLASSDISPDAPERHASHQVAGLPSVRRLTSTMAPTLPSPSASEPSDGAEPSGRARDTTWGSPRRRATSRSRRGARRRRIGLRHIADRVCRVFATGGNLPIQIDVFTARGGHEVDTVYMVKASYMVKVSAVAFRHRYASQARR